MPFLSAHAHARMYEYEDMICMAARLFNAVRAVRTIQDYAMTRI